MKNITIVLLLLISTLSFSQEFQGKAYYFSKTIFSDDLKEENSESKKKVDPAFEKALQEALKEASEKSYLLTFNKSECVYEQEQQLEKPKAASGEMQISVSISSSEGRKYINAKNKTSSTEDEIFDKEFIIVENIEKPDWKLVDDTKKIGDYTCFKAKLTIPVSDKQKKEYEEFLKKEEIKSSLFKIEEPKDKIITAWYTPEIPVSFGPNNYWGLPGLILEINEPETIILCSKIVLNTKEKATIKVPNKGQKVSQKEFDAIQKKKYDSMKDENGVIMFKTTN
jgi:GLPGLI family protein